MAGKALAKKNNGHGGPRANSGRKRGGENEKNRQLAIQAAEQGVTPMEVMLANMRYYHERAESFDQSLTDLAATMTPERIKAGGAETVQLLTLVAKVGEFRMKAQECAVDAAPYVHPRLAALAVKIDPGDSRKPPLEITRELAPAIAASAYADLLANDR